MNSGCLDGRHVCASSDAGQCRRCCHYEEDSMTAFPRDRDERGFRLLVELLSGEGEDGWNFRMPDQVTI